MLYKKYSLFICLVVAFALNNCSNQTESGKYLLAESVKSIQVNDSKKALLTQLGQPSFVDTFDPNIWYYTHFTNDLNIIGKPRNYHQLLVKITLANEQVKSIVYIDNVLANKPVFDSTITPIKGRESSFGRYLSWSFVRGSALAVKSDN